MLKADVVVPVYRDVEVTRACLESVLALSGKALGSLIVVYDHGPEPELLELLRTLRDADRRVRLVENESNLGFVGSANRGLALRQHDVVLLNSDTRVTAGWLAELLEVLHAQPRIAAACPLSNNATLCSVPDFGEEAPPEALETQPLELAGLPRYTELPTAVGFCLALRDDVLNAAGSLDPLFGRGYNEENDWCQRVQAMGFSVVRANRCLVFHLGRVSFGADRDELEARNARLLSKRWPNYLEQTADFAQGPEARVAATAVRASIGELRVTLDLSHVTAPRIHGTSVYAVELALAVNALDAVELDVIAGNDEMAQHLGEQGLHVRRTGDELESDLIHRPSQVYVRAELRWLLEQRGHLAFTWQDLIAYRSPTALGAWPKVREFRALTWSALQAAQGVLAISESAKADLVTTFGLEPEAVHVTPLGVGLTRPSADTIAQTCRRHLLEGPYLICLGSDWAHKNLSGLLAGYAVFRARREAPPPLILVGPRSRSPGALYDSVTQWPAGVRWLGEVSAGDVAPLIAGAVGLVMPSVYEGFGLPILEAMAVGTPVLSGPFSSLPEVAGGAAMVVNDLSPGGLSAALTKLVDDASLREKLSADGLARAATFTWQRTAQLTVDAWNHIARSPRASSLRARAALTHLLEDPAHRPSRP